MKWWQLTKRNADLERELQTTLELEEEEQREAGLSEAEARYAARRAIGNTTLIKEQIHDEWRWVWLDRFLQDIRYSLRQMRGARMFTVTVVGTLALGIGSAAAMFTIIDNLILRPVPYRDPQRLVLIQEGDKWDGGLARIYQHAMRRQSIRCRRSDQSSPARSKPQLETRTLLIPGCSGTPHLSAENTST